MKLELRRLKSGIAHSIGHAVCYGKLADKDFAVSEYVRECQGLFEILGVSERCTQQVLLHGVIKGLREYEMLQGEGSLLGKIIRSSSLNSANAAAQLHPSLSPMIADIEELGFLCEELQIVGELV